MVRSPKFNLAQLTSGLIGLEYELGKMDCFMLIMAYLKKRGISVPERYRGWTLETYKKLYKQSPARARQIMIDFMDEHLDKAHPNKTAPGDIYLLRLKNHPPALAINGGNATVICAAEKKGVVAVPLRYYSIEGAWKCHKQSQ
jgi:hypothetical protein